MIMPYPQRAIFPSQKIVCFEEHAFRGVPVIDYCLLGWTHSHPIPSLYNPPTWFHALCVMPETMKRWGGSPVFGILQARILEWVATPSSRASSEPRDWTQVSWIVSRFSTIWATREAQKYCSGYPIPSPGELPTQESNQGLLHCRWILCQLRYQGSPSPTPITFP